MDYERVLPFPRGTTLCDGQITPDANTGKGLLGRLYTVRDTVHGTTRDVTLRLVKNDTTGAFTVARKFLKFGTDAGDLGRKIDGIASAAGSVAKPFDDAYTVGASIPSYDCFYVVEAGPCYCKTTTTTTNLAAQGGVVTTAAGLVSGSAPAAGNVVLGRIETAVTTTSTIVVVDIDFGFSGGEGA